MRFKYLTLLIILTPLLAYSSNVTQEQIDTAEKTRMMGRKIGLDKITPEKMISAAFAIGGGKDDLTTEERKVMKCIYSKSIKMQYDSPIEEFAKYISDKKYAADVDESFNKECGFYNLDQSIIEKRKSARNN